MFQYNAQSLTANWTISENSQKLAMVLRGAANLDLGYRLFSSILSEAEDRLSSSPMFSKILEVQGYIVNQNASAIKHAFREFSDQVCDPYDFRQYCFSKEPEYFDSTIE